MAVKSAQAEACATKTDRRLWCEIGVVARDSVEAPPLGFFVSVHSKEDEVVCFDTVLQVFILLGLAGVYV